MRLNYSNNNIVFSIIIYTKYNMILDYAKLFLIFFIIKNMYILKWAESIIFIKKNQNFWIRFKMFIEISK